MMSARIFQILLAGLFVGLIPLHAGDTPAPAPGGDGGVVILPYAAGGDGGVVILPYADGGDGGVVILPSLNNVLALAQTLSSGHGESNHVSVTVSLAGDFDMFRFKLPDSVANPLVAVAYIEKYRMAWTVPVVANYLEIDREQFRELEDLGIKHLEVLVLADETVFGFCIEIDKGEKTDEAEEEEAEKAEKPRKGKAKTKKAR